MRSHISTTALLGHIRSDMHPIPKQLVSVVSVLIFYASTPISKLFEVYIMDYIE